MEHTSPQAQTTKSSTWDKIQTYTIVTIISALIWLYAESENVKQQKPLTFNVLFVAPPGQNLAIAPGSKQQAQITVRCATSQFAQLQRLQNQPIQLTVTSDDPQSPNYPEQIINLRDKLHDSPIGELGVRIEDVQPKTVSLRIEQIEQVTAPISIDSVVSADMQLAGPPSIAPTTATVELPATVARHAGDIKLVAKLNPENADRLDENVPHDLNVPITLVLPRYLRDEMRYFTPTITPEQATLTITIRKRTDSIRLPGVPILIAAPWAELKRFSIELEDDQRVLDQEVELTGPSDVIEKIKKGELKVWAELRLTADDLESGITSKALRINVPPNVRVDSAIPSANFIIKPVASLAPSPAAPNGPPSP